VYFLGPLKAFAHVSSRFTLSQLHAFFSKKNPSYCDLKKPQVAEASREIRGFNGLNPNNQNSRPDKDRVRPLRNKEKSERLEKGGMTRGNPRLRGRDK